MRYYPEVPARRNRAILSDAIVVVLIVFFAWLGIKVHDATDDLASLGRGVQEAGTSVQNGFSDAGAVVSDVPLVGDPLGAAFDEVGAQTGGNTAALGESGERAVQDLARILGWVTFGLPSLILLLWAVPRRIARMRGLTAAGRFLREPMTPERRKLLAMRAAFHLPYETLLPYSRDPIGDLEVGRHEALLSALFEDSGLRAPPTPEGQ